MIAGSPFGGESGSLGPDRCAQFAAAVARGDSVGGRMSGEATEIDGLPVAGERGSWY